MTPADWHRPPVGADRATQEAWVASFAERGYAPRAIAARLGVTVARVDAVRERLRRFGGASGQPHAHER